MWQPPFDIETLPDEAIGQMNTTREALRALLAWMRERHARAPAVGSLAPEFAIERLSSRGERTGEEVRLSEYHGRPVALVFGSYT
jgi:hypothetical protein